MARLRPAVGVACVSFALAACGLGVVGSTPVADTAVGLSDGSSASTDAAFGVDAAPQESGRDAPSDSMAPDAGGCTVLIEDDFLTASPSWQLAGSAAFAAGRVDLTPAQSGQAGALFWKSAITFGSVLHVEVGYAISTPGGSTQAEGLMVAWLDPSTPYTLGPIGQGMALCGDGLSGTAVELNGRNSEIVALSSISGSCGTDAITHAAVGAASTVSVEIRADRIEGTLGTGEKSTQGRVNPMTGLFGFTAATGPSATTARSQHSITHVKVTACP
jgi:hypothetical protein